ncbi:MAG: hypothetical protein K8R21_12015 [Leptospira sp.]|nr:hypothetical protein [Leptospira sp.]
MKYFLSAIFLSVTVAYFTGCASGDKPKQETAKDTTNPVNEAKKPENQDKDEFFNPKEGFITPSTFQVVVFSLKENSSEARSDSMDIAKKKSVNMLTSSAKQPLTSSGKTEIRSIVEESGKITKESGQLEGKYYFIFQITKPGLQTYVKEKLN